MKGGGRKKERYHRPLRVNVDYTRTVIDPCDSLSFETKLQKPLVEIFKKLKVGQPLRVIKSGKSLSVETNNSNVCGHIVSTYNPQIISCIDKGKKFKAIILELSARTCLVNVQIDG